jgi:hypothetical protein
MVVCPMSGESKITCGSKYIQIGHFMRHTSRFVEVSMRGQRVTNRIDAMKNNNVAKVHPQGDHESRYWDGEVSKRHKESTKHGEELRASTYV